MWARNNGTRDIKNVNPGLKRGRQKRQTKKRVVGIGRRGRWQRRRELQQSETKHYVFCFLKRFMPLLPLTYTMTRRKQTDTPRLSLLHPVVHVLPRWGTDHGRHRLGVNRVPFIWLDAAGGPIRQPKRGWARGRSMLSQPLKLTSSLGTLQTTVKLIKLPWKDVAVCVSGMSKEENEDNYFVRMPAGQKKKKL